MNKSVLIDESEKEKLKINHHGVKKMPETETCLSGEASMPHVVYDLSSGQESESSVSTDGENSYADIRLRSSDEDVREVEQANASVICEDLQRHGEAREHPASNPNRKSLHADKK